MVGKAGRALTLLGSVIAAGLLMAVIVLVLLMAAGIWRPPPSDPGTPIVTFNQGSGK